MCNFQVDEPNKVFPVLTLGHGLAWGEVHILKQVVAFAGQYIHIAAHLHKSRNQACAVLLGIVITLLAQGQSACTNVIS